MKLTEKDIRQFISKETIQLLEEYTTLNDVADCSTTQTGQGTSTIKDIRKGRTRVSENNIGVINKLIEIALKKKEKAEELV